MTFGEPETEHLLMMWDSALGCSPIQEVWSGTLPNDKFIHFSSYIGKLPPVDQRLGRFTDSSILMASVCQMISSSFM